MRKALLLGLIFAFSSSIQSQSIVSIRENQADKYYSQQSYTKAARKYLSLLKKDPGNKSILLKLARSCYQEGTLDQALDYYNRVIQKRYLVNSIDYLNYAQVLCSMEQYDLAEQWTRKYLAIEPRNEVAQNLLYQLKSRNGLQDKYYDQYGATQKQEVQEATLFVINFVQSTKSYILTTGKVIEVMKTSTGQNIDWLDQLLAENKIIVTDRVDINPMLYKVDQTAIGEPHKSELDKLAKLMKKYRSIEFEIAAHTDIDGSDGYNQQLSQSRANAARDYLLNKDVQTERLLAIGYGENVPVYSCIDHACNADENRYNHRLELRLVYMDNQGIVSN